MPVQTQWDFSPGSDRTDALSAKEAGQRLAIKHADEEWRERVWRAVADLAELGESFCADQVRERAGDPPAGTHPNAMGALITRAAKAGLIRHVGYTTSRRVVGHGNLVRMWQGATCSR